MCVSSSTATAGSSSSSVWQATLLRDVGVIILPCKLCITQAFCFLQVLSTAADDGHSEGFVFEVKVLSMRL
jgi:hypothetical protein